MGRVITFYSYKGGVGRTMALANVAVLLSQWGYKTLMVDWDLEAPGLEFYFKNLLDLEKVSQREGLADLLDKASDSELTADQPINWRDSLINIEVKDQEGTLHLLTAGKRDENYFNKVRELDLKSFYENKGGFFIERLRNEWKEAYDYILVDSRTGITDLGGVCTIQMPDLLVGFFTATDQGLNGVIDVFQKASRARQKLPVSRLTLQALPIPCRFDTGKEFKISQDWLDRFASDLSEFYANWLSASASRRDFLATTKIPYVAYFSFGEKLPVLEEGTVDPAGLGYAYENLAALIANNLDYADLLLSSRDHFIKAASKGAPREELLKNGSALKSESQPRHGPRIFLSYAREDRGKVKEIYHRCSKEGFTPWMDEMDLLAGQDREVVINQAIQRSDFFLLCLSPSSAQGSHKEELLFALDLWKNRFQRSLWLIPVRLEESEVPDDLRGTLWVDLFAQSGWERLLQTLRDGLKRREIYRSLVLTSSKTESDTVRAHLFDPQEKRLPDGAFYEMGSFFFHERRWEVSLYEIDIENPLMTHELTNLIQSLNPSILLAVGIASGGKRVSIGDVVVATDFFIYSPDSHLAQPIRNLWHSSNFLAQRVRFEAKKSDWVSRVKISHTRRTPRAILGKIVVVKDDHRGSAISLKQLGNDAQVPDALAFELGGHVLLKFIHSLPNLHSLVIRGIATLIDNPEWSEEDVPLDVVYGQDSAEQNACAFAFEVLAKLERRDLANGNKESGTAKDIQTSPQS